MTQHEKQVFSHRDKMDDRVKQAAKSARKIWDSSFVSETLRFIGWV
jgi:hypothetical protein